MIRGFLMLLFALMILSACSKPPNIAEQRARDLGSQLRCPVCRGVPIADSPAPLANEMMGVVKQQIAEGKSDPEILQFFESRYGEWVLLKPKAQGSTLLIWILPALVLVGGGVGILLRLRKKTS